MGLNPRTVTKDSAIVALLQEMVRKGWVIEAGRCHPKLRAPWGASIAIAGTPSCHRAALNLRTCIRRMERQHKEEKRKSTGRNSDCHS